MVWGLIFKFNSFQVNFCKWHKTGVQFNFFACECTGLPAPVIEEIILSSLSVLGSLVKY